MFRLRDLTLRSVALTSRKAFDLWYPFSLQSITTSYGGLLSLHQLLNRKGTQYGDLIESVQFKPTAHSPFMRMMTLQRDFCSRSNLPFSAGPVAREEKGRMVVKSEIYRHLVNLSSLILESAKSIFPLEEKIDGRSVPLRFLTHSLKKLYVPLWSPEACHLDFNAKNAIWLLINCQVLEEAAIGVCLSVSDFKFLSEYGEAFKGLAKVQRLALRIKFVALRDDRKTYWGLERDYQRSYKGGSKKTEAVYNLLKVTSNLTALEIGTDMSPANPGDDMMLFSGCLRSLQASFDSLRHLRLLSVGPDHHEQHNPHHHDHTTAHEVHENANHQDEDDHHHHHQHPTSTEISFFKSLRILTSNINLLFELSKHPQVPLPSTLEIIHLPFYDLCNHRKAEEHFEEDLQLRSIITSRDLHVKGNLKEVVVPSRSTGSDGNYGTDLGTVDSNLHKKAWTSKRKASRFCKGLH